MIVEHYTVAIPVNDGSGDSLKVRKLGPFLDKGLATAIADGRGQGGRDAEVTTLYYATDDGLTGYAFQYKPTQVPLPIEHTLAKVLGAMSGNDLDEILGALRP